MTTKPGDNRGRLFQGYGGELFLVLYRIGYRMGSQDVEGLSLIRPQGLPPKIVRRHLGRFVPVWDAEEWTE